MASRAARDSTLPTISLRDPLQADPVAGAVRIGAAADGQAAGGPFAAGDRGVVGPAVRAGQLPLLLQHQLAVDQAPAHRTSTLDAIAAPDRSEEHTSELQSLMRTSYAVFCLKKKKQKHQ